MTENFSRFMLLRRFRENLTKPFYFYLSCTCGSPGGTPSVISFVVSVYKSEYINDYEGWLLNNETTRLEGALEGWGNKLVVRWVAASLLYSRTKTHFRHYFNMCAAAV